MAQELGFLPLLPGSSGLLPSVWIRPGCCRPSGSEPVVRRCFTLSSASLSPFHFLIFLSLSFCPDGQIVLEKIQDKHDLFFHYMRMQPQSNHPQPRKRSVTGSQMTGTYLHLIPAWLQKREKLALLYKLRSLCFFVRVAQASIHKTSGTTQSKRDLR